MAHTSLSGVRALSLVVSANLRHSFIIFVVFICTFLSTSLFYFGQLRPLPPLLCTACGVEL